MILTIDNVPVVVPEPLQNLTCFLCNSNISFINKNPNKMFLHLQVQHEIHANHDLLLMISLFDKKLISEAISSFNNISEAGNINPISDIIDEDRRDVTKSSDEEYGKRDNIEAIVVDKPNESLMLKKYDHIDLNSDVLNEFPNVPNEAFSKSDETHKKTKNAQYKTYKEHICPYCQKTLFSQLKLLYHKRKRHAIERSLALYNYSETCPYCQKRLISRAALTYHVKAHHSLESSCILCSKCGFSTDNFKEYTNHIKSHNECICKICNEVFVDKASFIAHKNKIHRKTEMCSFCGNTYKNIKSHIQNNHSSEFKRCPNPACNYTSKQNGKINRHYKYMHSDIMEKCENCGKEVKNAREHKLRSCIARSTRVKLECLKCSKMFSSKQGLNKHLKDIHSDSKDKLCSQCDYKTYSNSNLRMHISNVHEGNFKEWHANIVKKVF